MSVEFHDVDQPDTRQRFQQVLEQAQRQRLSYPLVLVNGQLRGAGNVDAYQLIFLADEDRRRQGLPARF